MRPLFHPAPEDVTVEGILHALSDPARARIFAGIVAARSAQTCSSYLAICEQPIPKSTLSQHFKVLREAGLIRSERRGVELLNTPRCTELGPRFGSLITAVLEAHAAQEARLQPARRAKRVRRS